ARDCAVSRGGTPGSYTLPVAEVRPPPPAPPAEALAQPPRASAATMEYRIPLRNLILLPPEIVLTVPVGRLRGAASPLQQRGYRTTACANLPDRPAVTSKTASSGPDAAAR